MKYVMKMTVDKLKAVEELEPKQDDCEEEVNLEPRPKRTRV